MMLYKKPDKKQIIISLDRLTRFKNTKEKYLRVYFDILLSNLLEPKYKKKELEKLDYETLTDYVSQIINSALDNISTDYSVNEKLKEYENKLYNNDIQTQKLLNNKINYNAAIKLISENDVINLQWLKLLEKHKNTDELRQKYACKYPVKIVILVEGITEEILLPSFSKFLKHDFYKEGIHIIAAGGKNQVVKAYYDLSEKLRIPIYILLDKDAEENQNQINTKLRQCDKIHLVSCGEFEDLLPKSLIIKCLNKKFENFAIITENDFNNSISTVKNLEEIYKTKGICEFKKADFAKLVKENITEEADISTEIKNIINELYNK